MTLTAARPIEATPPPLAPFAPHRIAESSEDRDLWEALLDQRVGLGASGRLELGRRSHEVPAHRPEQRAAALKGEQREGENRERW